MTDANQEQTIIRRTLVLEELIKRKMDEIVAAATNTALLLENNNNMENSQIQNVLNVAQESESVAVVINFIRYQLGRSGSTARAWQEKGFGLRVIEDISAEDGPVVEVRKAIMDGLPPDVEADDELSHQTHLKLTRYYLGYLRRAFIFGKSADVKNSWTLLKQGMEAKQHV